MGIHGLAASLRHHHVQYRNSHRVTILVENPQRLVPICGNQHMVPGILQNPAGDRADKLVVFRHQQAQGRMGAPVPEGLLA